MLNAMPVYPLGYYQGLSLILWIISIAVFFIGTVLFFNKRKGIEMESLKMSYLAYAVICLGMGLTRIFFIVAVYFPEQYDFITLLGYVTSLAALIFWLYVTETYLVKKTKRIFTAICFIVFCFCLLALFGIISRELALEIQYILLPVALGIIIILYLYIIIKTTGTIRIKARWVLIGLFLIAIANVMDGQGFILAFPDIPLIVAPLIMTFGTLLFIFTQLYFE